MVQYIAVRVGDLNKFQEGLAQFDSVFKKDKTYTLILRLRHNVIKTGIRMISLSYSKISLRDICLKLHLDSEEDAEFIVSKAIRDGVIDATLDHNGGFMKSKVSMGGDGDSGCRVSRDLTGCVFRKLLIFIQPMNLSMHSTTVSLFV